MTTAHYPGKKKRGFPLRPFLLIVFGFMGYHIATKPGSLLDQSAAPPKASASVLNAPKAELKNTGPKKPISQFFRGGSDSAVARVVGHAEGTRTADGSKTRAYYGHKDPGNGVWNLGSFSYQHGAKSPEDGDDKQLPTLESQAKKIIQQANKAGIDMTLEEALNGIDLANQAPLAALGKGAFPQKLKQARSRGLKGSKAILWARTQSYWDPDKHRWDAPGLGNSEENIEHDQNRRMTAIARALDTMEQQKKLAAAPNVKVLPQALVVRVAATAFDRADAIYKSPLAMPTPTALAPSPAPLESVPPLTSNMNNLTTPGDVSSGWRW